MLQIISMFVLMHKLILCLAIIILIPIFIYAFSCREKMTLAVQNESCSRLDDRYYYKSKCISCERDLVNRCGEQSAALGIQTCFDCQRQLMEKTLEFNGGFGTKKKLNDSNKLNSN